MKTRMSLSTLFLLVPTLALAQASQFPVVGYGQTAQEARLDMVAQARQMCGSKLHAQISNIQITQQPGGHYQVIAQVSCIGS